MNFKCKGSDNSYTVFATTEQLRCSECRDIGDKRLSCSGSSGGDSVWIQQHEGQPAGRAGACSRPHQHPEQQHTAVTDHNGQSRNTGTIERNTAPSANKHNTNTASTKPDMPTGTMANSNPVPNVCTTERGKENELLTTDRAQKLQSCMRQKTGQVTRRRNLYK